MIMNRLYLYLSVITAALCFEVVLCSWCYHEGKETEKEKYIKMLQQCCFSRSSEQTQERTVSFSDS